MERRILHINMSVIHTVAAGNRRTKLFLEISTKQFQSVLSVPRPDCFTNKPCVFCNYESFVRLKLGYTSRLIENEDWKCTDFYQWLELRRILYRLPYLLMPTSVDFSCILLLRIMFFLVVKYLDSSLDFDRRLKSLQMSIILLITNSTTCCLRTF